METQSPDWKKIIVEELQLLSSREEQLEYERNVPHVDITNELVCRWFDESYYPNDSKFRSYFSQAELAVLADFSQFYNERLSMLPSSKGTVHTWLACHPWQEVMQKAASTLKYIHA